MASILLTGSPDLLPAFIGSVGPDHTLYYHGAGVPDAFASRVTAIGTDALPGVDAIVDVEIDRARKFMGLEALAGFAGGAARPALFTNMLTATATEVASRVGFGTVIGFSYVPSLYAPSGLIEAAPAMQTAAADADAALDLLGAITGRAVERLADRLALVSARTLSMVINEAAFALMEGVADAEDIDVAMKLGTNYPEGPLAWADAIGVDVVLAILDALHTEYGEERYRPCVLLRQLARARGTFVAS